jgi:hypothetical protein
MAARREPVDKSHRAPSPVPADRSSIISMSAAVYGFRRAPCRDDMASYAKRLPIGQCCFARCTHEQKQRRVLLVRLRPPAACNSSSDRCTRGAIPVSVRPPPRSYLRAPLRLLPIGIFSRASCCPSCLIRDRCRNDARSGNTGTHRRSRPASPTSSDALTPHDIRSSCRNSSPPTASRALGTFD